jgi:hypothetical protein
VQLAMLRCVAIAALAATAAAKANHAARAHSTVAELRSQKLQNMKVEDAALLKLQMAEERLRLAQAKTELHKLKMALEKKQEH